MTSSGSSPGAMLDARTGESFIASVLCAIAGADNTMSTMSARTQGMMTPGRRLRLGRVASRQA